jgi:hypothetical protein
MAEEKPPTLAERCSKAFPQWADYKKWAQCRIAARMTQRYATLALSDDEKVLDKACEKRTIFKKEFYDKKALEFCTWAKGSDSLKGSVCEQMKQTIKSLDDKCKARKAAAPKAP